VNLYLLGTGAAVSDPHRTTTMLAVEEEGRVLLIDCGGDVVQRAMEAGVDPARIHALVLTHEHPDHVAGFPLLIEKLWLLGRTEPLPIYGTAGAIRVARALFDAFETASWEGVPEREWHTVAHHAGATVFSDDTFDVTATPVEHPVPTIGLRVLGASGATVAYSADTSVSDAVAELARDCDVLVHEATGTIPGVHSSPEEAARTAAAADVGRLVLVHLAPALSPDDLERARRVFPATDVGEELGVLAVAPAPV